MAEEKPGSLAEGDRIPNVLLVDDRTENIDSLQAILDGGGARLLGATSGEQALELLLEHDVSLVLLDVQMPRMDGYEVARLMRGNRKTRLVPIIFITAIMRDERAVMRGYESGAIDYIAKPVDPAILRSKVELFLELDRNRRRLQEAYAQLGRAKAYYESILNAAGEGVLGISRDGIIDFANPAALAMLGYRAGELRGKPVAVFHPHEETAGEHGEPMPFRYCWRAEAEYRVDDDLFIRRDGTGLPVSFCCSPVAGRSAGSVLVFQDITTRKRLEDQLRQQAITDHLTGLNNRNGFKEAFHVSLERARRSGKSVALMFVDLDNFKRINDTLGHDVGDQLLRAVAARLKDSVRPYDIVSRIGGDEFTVMLDELDDAADASAVADKILSALRRPFDLKNNMQLAIGASIGISSYPECGGDTETLMQAADVAMYQAKNAGRNLFQFYMPEMNAKAHARLMLEQALRAAVERQDFELHYQPQVDLGSGRLVGFEALLRWQQGNPGNIEPDVFVPMLEETGLIVPMGSWVFSTGCRQRQEWGGRLPDDCKISLNLSPRQFADKNLVAEIRRILERNALPSYQLEIELTEGMLMLDTAHTRSVLHSLKDMGLALSVDDFGTGYSSLAYLKQFALDALKIDKHFIEHLTTSDRDVAITTSIIQLGHNLGLDVIAEGVETEEQMSLLQELGCDVVQGFYFGKPLPAEEAGGFPHEVKLH
ncbi:MAG TPA: EAL domain-containing protein [Paucimonas sp.]|nr:EAL domain-containing protein [Paucimonas sp.]